MHGSLEDPPRRLPRSSAGVATRGVRAVFAFNRSLSPRAFLLASFFLFSFFPLESSRSSLDRSSYFNFQHFPERAFQKHLSRIDRNPASPPSLSTRDPIKRLTNKQKEDYRGSRLVQAASRHELRLRKRVTVHRPPRNECLSGGRKLPSSRLLLLSEEIMIIPRWRLESGEEQTRGYRGGIGEKRASPSNNGTATRR